MRKAFNMRFEPELIARVDRVAGDGQRTAFVERAIDKALAEYELFHGPKVVYRCPFYLQGCGFEATSDKARCPTHGRRAQEVVEDEPETPVSS